MLRNFAKKILKKNLSDETIINAFKIAKKIGIRATANYMIGLPFETEKDILKSIEFNKRLNPPSISVCYFVPFMGTELYEISKNEGFYPEFNPDADIFSESTLDMPHLSKKRISELMELFVKEQNNLEKEELTIGAQK